MRVSGADASQSGRVGAGERSALRETINCVSRPSLPKGCDRISCISWSPAALPRGDGKDRSQPKRGLRRNPAPSRSSEAYPARARDPHSHSTGIRTITRPGSAQSLDRDPHNHSTGIRTKHLSWIHTTSHSHRAGSKLGPSSGSSFRIQDALCIHSVRAESRQSPDPGGIQAGSGRDPGGIRAGSRRDPGAIRAGSGRNPGGIREGSEWDPGMIRVGPGRDPGGIQEGSGRDLEEIWA